MRTDPVASASELLIISDVHLCRARPGVPPGAQRELAAFLHHHAASPPGSLYRLIIAGDLFDFDHHARELADRGPEAASLRMLGDVLDDFPEIVTGLAAFLAAGHEIVVLRGNHDVDLAWPSVRQRLTDAVRGAGAADEALARLRFTAWFYYEPGRIYVEHGQQYDPDNAAAEVLAPFLYDARGEARLHQTLGTHWVTGFCPVIPEIAYHVDHTRGAFYYIPMLIRRYGLKAPWIWLRYLAFTWHALRHAGPHMRAQAPGHVQRRDAYAREAGMPPALAARIEDLAEAPRFASRWSTAGRLHMAFAHLITAAATLGALAVSLDSATLGGCALAALVGAVLPALLLSGKFQGDEDRRMKRAAALIASLLDVRAVVFGHLHHALRHPLGGDRVYLNSGTWMAEAFPRTYVRWPAHGAPELLQWDAPRAGASGAPTCHSPRSSRLHSRSVSALGS